MKKILYLMKDPFGGSETKIGITGNPDSRLGQYQNSYSSNSYVARFDRVWVSEIVNEIEDKIKNQCHWQIEKDGKGHSEWISLSLEEIESKIQTIIDGCRIKATKIEEDMLPLNIHNLDEFKGKYLD